MVECGKLQVNAERVSRTSNVNCSSSRVTREASYPQPPPPLQPQRGRSGRRYAPETISSSLDSIHISPRVPTMARHSRRVSDADARDEVQLSLLSQEHDDAHDDAVSFDNVHKKNKTLSTKDRKAMTLLIVLYLIQGVPLGLALGSVPFILREHLSYSQLGVFALSNYPYSLKLLWSPIIDSTFFPSVGRRKSWIIPMQLIIGSLMLYISANVDRLFEHPADNVYELTFVFTSLVFFSATQDIAVDGWALTLLSQENLSFASTCQTIGLNTGFFASFTVFLALNSEAFSQKWGIPRLTMSTYLQFCSLLCFGVTFWLVLFQKEVCMFQTAMRRFFNLLQGAESLDHSEMTVSSVYKTIWDICKLKRRFRSNCKWSTYKLSLSCTALQKLGFQANDSVTSLKMIEKGLGREDLAIVVLIDFPFQILGGWLAAKWSSGDKPLRPWIWAFWPRLAFALISTFIVYLFPTPPLSYGFFTYLVIHTVLQGFASTIQFVGITAFHTKISDPLIGGTYMTLLNTFTNLGGTWPKYFVLKGVDFFSEAYCRVKDADTELLVKAAECVSDRGKELCADINGECVTEQDGYYYVSAICVIFGVLFLVGYVIPTARRLQGELVSSLRGVLTNQIGRASFGKYVMRVIKREFYFLFAYTSNSPVKMATTTMHFGPEWMRAKPQTLPARHQPPPSPSPPQSASATQSQQLATSTYSALVTPVAQEPDKRDESRPFRYNKDEMLRIYKEGGGRGGLNLEVERWEGIVRDVGAEPVGLREMSEVEKKLFAGPLNSELRRRQSADLTNSLSSPSDRQRLSHSNSATNSTMRYGPFMGRRRDSTGEYERVFSLLSLTFILTRSISAHLPRKLSLSNIQGGTLASPRDALPSPRNRIGAFGSGFDGVLNSGDSWSRKRPSAGVAGLGGGILARGEGKEEDARYSEIKEEEESTTHHSSDVHDGDPAAIMHPPSSGPNMPPSNLGPLSSSDLDSVGQGMAVMSLETLNQPNANPRVSSTTNPLPSGPPPGLTDPASIEWSYLDPQGQVQGPFRADVMQKWFDDGYFIPDLLVKRTHIDADWIAVRILERRAAGANIFLSQISSGPPGLAIHTESPKSYSPAHEQSMFNGYQPVPTRTLRPTLDSYLNGTSPTESPSSSLGAGRFGNGSPDPSTFGGRAGSNVYSSDSTFGSRTFGGRAAFQDSVSDARTLNNNSMGRVPTIDTFNAYSGGGDSSPWSAGPGQIGQSFNDNEQHPYSNGFNGIGSGMIGNPLPVNHTHSINQEHFGDTTYSGMGGLGGRHDSPIARQPSEVNGMSFNSSTMNGLGSQFGAPAHFSQSPSVPYAVQHHQSVSPFVDLLSQIPEAPNVAQTPISAVQPTVPHRGLQIPGLSNLPPLLHPSCHLPDPRLQNG
ncbi:acetyl-coenzyme A transporter 1-domain-containing protein [Boletus reticuloceps]|uniref:Acetyl-coenzyme A transporter 1-domain-containing protein n=1 Tax=Boletus reticuloceps TaxID=495285 RepID=A0A8I2Z237_9AGAM|nr:acetyl-coenzyme A transporter 1-domain-containing protein [Boletus reticuloceps]